MREAKVDPDVIVGSRISHWLGFGQRCLVNEIPQHQYLSWNCWHKSVQDVIYVGLLARCNLWRAVGNVKHTIKEAVEIKIKIQDVRFCMT